ncbi:hypothetical protein ACP70R_010657 [Stipagrostis hirtigluma subsp. patula]
MAPRPAGARDDSQEDPAPAAAHHVGDDDDGTISLWELLRRCGIDVDAFFPDAGAGAGAGAVQPQQVMHVDDPIATGEADADGESNDVAVLFQSDSTNSLLQKHIHEPAAKGSMGAVAAQPVGVASQNTTGSAEVLAADSLKMTIGMTRALAINKPRSSARSRRGTGSGIDLNLPAPESVILVSDDESSPESEPDDNPHERPLLGLIGRKDLPFQPFILESSEVAREAAEAARAAAAGNNRKRSLHNNIAAADPAPARGKPPPRHYYRRSTNKMANLDEKIERPKDEQLVERRSLPLMNAETDELEGKKVEIHARMMGQQGEEKAGEGSSSGGSDEHAPPSGN